ncbi:MAG: glucosyltransferase domain-containing protein [Planctomycetia bacterium]|nr:glucosyltransferase domain-containing protein [Planctomycetia bacterium]
MAVTRQERACLWGEWNGGGPMAGNVDCAGTGLDWSSPHTLLKGIFGRISGRIWFTFLSAMIVGVLVHAFALVNDFTNHDRVYSMYDYSTGFLLGRWMNVLMPMLRSNYCMPWIHGVRWVVLNALCVCLVVSILDIRRKFNILLVCGVLVTAPCVGVGLAFMFNAGGPSLALVLSGVFLAQKYRYGFIPAIFLFLFGIAFYQSSITFAVALFAICILKETLLPHRSTRDILWRIVRYLVAGGGAAALYLAATKVIMAALGLTLNSYQGIDRVGQVAVAELPLRIFYATCDFFGYFLWDTCGYLEPVSWMFRLSGLVLLVVTPICVLFLGIRKLRSERNWFQFSLTVLIVMMIPLAFNLIWLLLPVIHRIYLGMQGCLRLAPLIPIVMMELMDRGDPAIGGRQGLWWRRAGVWVISVALVLMSYSCYLTTNHMYMKLAVSYESAFAYAQRILDRLETDDAYIPGKTCVLFAVEKRPDGLPDLDPDANEPTTFKSKLTALQVRFWNRGMTYAQDRVRKMEAGATGTWRKVLRHTSLFLERENQRFHLMMRPMNFFRTFGWNTRVEALSLFKPGVEDTFLRHMIKHYLHVRLPIADADVREEILDSEDVRQMPCFPEKESLRLIRGVMVVKIPQDPIEP